MARSGRLLAHTRGTHGTPSRNRRSAGCQWAQWVRLSGSRRYVAGVVVEGKSSTERKRRARSVRQAVSTLTGSRQNYANGRTTLLALLHAWRCAICGYLIIDDGMR